MSMVEKVEKLKVDGDSRSMALKVSGDTEYMLGMRQKQREKARNGRRKYEWSGESGESKRGRWRK